MLSRSWSSSLFVFCCRCLVVVVVVVVVVVAVGILAHSAGYVCGLIPGFLKVEGWQGGAAPAGLKA